ncbi:HNH endonuclease [Brachybacterium sp. P6-10-X1]|uniref:HNH endonuclease n=1 Tax=Brachybacterium sp. P6-10-X1 TaxID=1903186 RepID=UPI0012F77D54|nr:HNH endonuclease [Brachybacterium sp. P6-10-X1]
MVDRHKQRAEDQTADATDAVASSAAASDPPASDPSTTAGDTVSAATASGAAADGPAAAGDAGAVLPVRAWAVDARVPLTGERMVKLAGVEPASDQAYRVLHLHATVRERTILYARQQELLVEFFTDDPDTDGLIDEADISAMKIATGMRLTTRQAERLIRDAHRSVDLMPATFTHLAAGDMPEGFHQYLLRHVRSLTDEQVVMVDGHVAGWDLRNISRHTFETHLKTLIVRITAGTLPVPPQTQRRVDLEITDPTCGLATLMVTGPIPEITDLAHRLDVTALVVQKAQRAALHDTDTGEIPFDIDETLRDRGRPLSLAALRYAILTRTMLDTGPVPEPASAYKLLVTVPAMTLLGIEDAPGLIEGLTPIPAEQARALAAGMNTWQRILTDPTTGAYLPATADTYTPTAAMRLQLRLRHPVCAAPGCTRPTALAAEDDHIEEFNHHDATQGGATDLANLHRLCWLHHTIKTAGHIDPHRDSAGNGANSPPATTRPPGPPPELLDFPPGSLHLDPLPLDPLPGPTAPREHAHAVVEPTVTWWDIDDTVHTTTRDDVDLLTPTLARALDTAWAAHHRAREIALHHREIEARRPHRDRVTEQRTAEATRFTQRHHGSSLPDPNTPPDHRHDDPPPF